MISVPRHAGYLVKPSLGFIPRLWLDRRDERLTQMATVPMNASQAREAALASVSTREGSAVVARILAGRTADVKAVRSLARAYWQTGAALPDWNGQGDYDQRPYEALNSVLSALHLMIKSVMTNDEISTCRVDYIADAVRRYWSYQSPAK